VLAAVTVATVVTAGPRARSAEGGQPSLPDLPTLLAEVRQRLANPELVLERYHYRLRITERERDSSGRVTKTSVEVYEVYPNFRNTAGHRRLVERDGQPLPREEAARLQGEQRQAVEQAMAHRASESPEDRRRRLADEARERGDEARIVDDLFRVLEFRLVGRGEVNGEEAIELAFTPRPLAASSTTVGRIVRKAAGRAWVSEADRQLVRVELESTDTLTYGLGVVARVRPGARFVFERRRTDTREWVPAAYHLLARVRLMLVKPVNVDRTVEYYDFRPFPE
jgi:hypothetical protein